MRSLFLTVFFTLIVAFTGCDQVQHLAGPQNGSDAEICFDTPQVLNLGFYAYFAPMSYSADPDPDSPDFHTHHGYEADLLTALEALQDVPVTFSRTPIAEWDNIWLKSAEPAYDIIGGGITILDSRRQDATGQERVTFTSGHVTFRQSLLVRTADAARLSGYDALQSDVKVGVLAGTTGEARLLQITGIVDSEGVLVSGTRVETADAMVIADGTTAYTITASGASPNLVGRRSLHPATDNMPQVIYLGDEVGESALLDALAAGEIDVVARGEIGNQDAAHASQGAFVVTALDPQVEYGGFTLALEDAALARCIDAHLNYLTDNKQIGYAEWLADPMVFMERAEQRNAGME